MNAGVILDFDGTIIDSESNLFSTINKHLSEGGHDLMDIEFYKTSIGTESQELDNYIIERLGPKGYQVINEDHKKTCKDLKCNDSILELINYCVAQGVPMSVATSSVAADIIPMLKNLGIYDYFVSVRGKEHADRIKPDPKLYQLAIEDLGLSPSQIFAVEDTVNGAIAAEHSGVNVIVLTNEMTEDLDFSGVNYHSKDINFDEIIKVLER